MARRATYFFDVHKTTAPRILVSGAWEYMRPGRLLSSADTLQQLSRALDIMRYDVGFLSREEAQTLNHMGVKPGDWQLSAADREFSKVMTARGDAVGFIRFPSLPDGQNVPSKVLIDQLTRDIKKYRKEVRLLIALSDWGWQGEREYLASGTQPVPDFLLGSGRGAGVNGRLQADDRCVWVRPYDKGRSIAEITIYEWPDRKNSFAWTPSKNYKTTSIGLNDSFMDYPAVNAVIE